jgi:hypothetical protein
VIHPYFEGFIQFFIGINSLLLALDEPNMKEGYSKKVRLYLTLKTITFMITVITVIFIMEATIKILVMGFVNGPHTYLKDSWNVMDFFIVFFSILNWVLESLSSVNVGFLRGFRALRALRPLRMVSKNEGMKTIVTSLLKSIPTLLNVLLISMLFYLVFGILNV